MKIEDLQNKILELEQEKTELLTQLENTKKTLEDKETAYQDLQSTSKTRISELQEHNQKLFLKVTHEKQEEKEEKKVFTSRLLGDYANTLNEEQLQILKDLEEGL